MKTKLVGSLTTSHALSIAPYLKDTQARSTSTPPNFTFDKNLQRYRYSDSGKFASREAVTNLTQKAIDYQRVIANELCEKLFAGEIKLSEWEVEAAALVRTTSIWQYSIGSGGIGRLSQRDYGIIGAEMRKQLLYLRRFTYQLQQGNLTKAQIRSRLGLYFEKTYTLYDRGRMESHKAAGYLWECRITTAKESCDDCLYYERMAIVPIGTLPSAGEQSACLGNCRCFKKFYREKPENADTLDRSMLNRGYGWLGGSIAPSLRQKLN